MPLLQAEITALPVPPALLGESPFWHPTEQRLYWLDIPGHALHRFRPADGQHQQWPLDSEPSCCAPLHGGCGLLLAMRDGIWRFDTDSGQRSLVAAPLYDPARQRFNDGKLAELPLPVRYPTMACFGGADLKTLYITTAQDRRPAEEQAAQPHPLAGCVLQLRLDVPGQAVNFAQL